MAEIEYEKSIGQLRPPKVLPSQEMQRSKKFLTVAELLDEYVQLYGLNHWGNSYLSYARHRIEHYIKPYLGNVIVQDLTTHDLYIYYDGLRDKPAVILKGHKEEKALLGDAYTDYGLVIAHEDGRPYEERQIADLLRSFIAKNNLPPVVFHSLRHCSATVKLQISGGNIKAVQGDTGHAQARMVTDLYAHTDNEARKKLAQKVEQDFFQKSAQTTQTAADDAQRAYQLLLENPDMAKLILAAMGKANTS